MMLRKINKKGQGSFSIFTFMITAFLAVVFFASLIWVMGLLNDTFTQVGIQNDQNIQPDISFPCVDDPTQTCTGNFYVNMTEASEQIWGSAYESIQALRLVAITYILALGIGIVIVGFLERKHPFMFFIYILFVLLGVIFAPTISNAYETLLDSGIFGGELVNFTASNLNA